MMAAPPKPWERKALNSHGFQDRNSLSQHVNQRATTTGAPSTNRNYHSASSVQRAPPPLPARPSQQSSLTGASPLNRYGYGGYGGGLGYGSYGGGMYGNYGGMYSSYGGGMYGGGLGGYGAQRFGMGATGNEPFSRFVQQAEESSRPAFQSIESIVQAFASVSMMLESTFHTVYNSFRAVLGVAEHFSRLKLHLAKIFSAIALFRFLRYLYRKLLVLVGLRTQGFAEDIWKEVESQTADGALALPAAGKQKKAPSWPIFMFFAVVVGGPYIIWKLLSSSEEESETSPEWASGEEDHIVARAEYDFDGDGERELSFHAGDLLHVAPKDQQPRVRGWLLASSGGDKTGIIPANYVKILGKRKGRKHMQGQGGKQDDTLKASQSSGELVAGSGPLPAAGLQTSQSVPANLHQTKRTVDFSEAFSASSADLDNSFVAGGAATDDLENRFVAMETPELESDFIFGSENTNNSNSVFGADRQEDFVGFEDTYTPGAGAGSVRNQPKDAS